MNPLGKHLIFIMIISLLLGFTLGYSIGKRVAYSEVNEVVFGLISVNLETISRYNNNSSWIEIGNKTFERTDDGWKLVQHFGTTQLGFSKTVDCNDEPKRCL